MLSSLVEVLTVTEEASGRTEKIHGLLVFFVCFFNNNPVFFFSQNPKKLRNSEYWEKSQNYEYEVRTHPRFQSQGEINVKSWSLKSEALLSFERNLSL